MNHYVVQIDNNVDTGLRFNNAEDGLLKVSGRIFQTKRHTLPIKNPVLRYESREGLARLLYGDIVVSRFQIKTGVMARGGQLLQNIGDLGHWEFIINRASVEVAVVDTKPVILARLPLWH